MSTTAVATREHAAETLFVGATPGELIAAATEAANAFSDVVRQRHLYKRIADRDHVLIEGWQVCGTLVGVFAIRDGGVAQLAWPALEALGEEPPEPPPEPRRSSELWPEWKAERDARVSWERRRDLLDARGSGLAYGFSVAFKAIKDGREVGWGEGRCTRAERNWATRDDYALASMAQTRGQSRALAAPLRFVVKLAGYESTPAEEYDGATPGGADSTSAPPAVVVLDEQGEREVAAALQKAWPSWDAHRFVTVLRRRLQGAIPEPAGVALRAWAWWAEQPGATGSERPQEAAQETREDPDPQPEGASNDDDEFKWSDDK